MTLSDFIFCDNETTYEKRKISFLLQFYYMNILYSVKVRDNYHHLTRFRDNLIKLYNSIPFPDSSHASDSDIFSNLPILYFNFENGFIRIQFNERINIKLKHGKEFGEILTIKYEVDYYTFFIDLISEIDKEMAFLKQNKQ